LKDRKKKRWKNPTLMSLFSFFFRFDERNMYRPRCEKKRGKNYKQNKLERGRKEWEKKHKLFFLLLLYLFKKAVEDIGHIVVFLFSRRCIVRRYSREDTSASAFKHE
jgi:hypothetical protein